VYLNPYFAQADVMCGVENGFGEWCNRIAFVSDRPAFGGFTTQTEPDVGVVPGRVLGGVGIEPVPAQPVTDVVPFGVVRDTFWPKSAVSWLVLAIALTLASVQLVTPTRRWRPRLPGFLRRSSRRASA
jgi:hypothetical protein